MFDKSFWDKFDERRKKWHETADQMPQKTRPKFFTISGDDVDILYGPDSYDASKSLENIGLPGEFPYTRGVHHTMYRGRMWTMRLFSGMGTPRQTNQRYKYLLKEGQNGLSVAFDLPTLMGYDSDHERSQGEIGKCGVAVDSLVDMETI